MIPVVDASAISALLFGEADGAWVHRMTSGLTFVVPAMFHFELSNICWTKMHVIAQQTSSASTQSW